MNARFYTQKTETVGIVVHVPSVPPGLDDTPILSGDILFPFGEMRMSQERLCVGLPTVDGGERMGLPPLRVPTAPGVRDAAGDAGAFSLPHSDPGCQRQCLPAPGVQQPRSHWPEAHAVLPEAKL